MKTTIAALAFVLSLGLVGCVDNNASVQIFGLCAIPTDCTFTATCGSYTLEIPALDLDVSATDQLYLFVEVHNQLANNADPSSGRTNTNNAFVEGYSVEYAGISLPGASGAVQQTVPAAGTSIVPIFPINSATGARLVTDLAAGAERTITAKLKLNGTYANGSSFETAAMEIPVRVCKGCLATARCINAPATATCPPDAAGQLPVVCN